MIDEYPNYWDLGLVDLTEAIEHCYVAQVMIDIFDQAEGRVLLLKPTGINTEGMERYEL